MHTQVFANVEQEVSVQRNCHAQTTSVIQAMRHTYTSFPVTCTLLMSQIHFEDFGGGNKSYIPTTTISLNNIKMVWLS